MYKCKCGRILDLTSEQWNDISKHPDSEHIVDCVCGDRLHIVTASDVVESGWFIADKYFDTDEFVEDGFDVMDEEDENYNWSE